MSPKHLTHSREKKSSNTESPTQVNMCKYLYGNFYHTFYFKGTVISFESLYKMRQLNVSSIHVNDDTMGRYIYRHEKLFLALSKNILSGFLQFFCPILHHIQSIYTNSFISLLSL